MRERGRKSERKREEREREGEFTSLLLTMAAFLFLTRMTGA